MAVTSLRIIKAGSITIDAFELAEPQNIAMKQFCGLGGGSTVTYIESDAKILVDTGFDFENNLGKDNINRNRERLSDALQYHGLKPSDIDMVFITHWHLDHFMNLPLFESCEKVMLKDALNTHSLDFRGVKEGEKLADGVTVMATPGHTATHASLLLETEHLRQSIKSDKGGRIMGIGKVRIAVAGDAIISPVYYLQDTIWKYNNDFYSENAARVSVQKLCDGTDFIIPGHGNIFCNIKKFQESPV
jgi:glyoxylase-like metal-dependent hydrolase (beta-lactamase superfamily II)